MAELTFSECRTKIPTIAVLPLNPHCAGFVFLHLPADRPVPWISEESVDPFNFMFYMGMVGQMAPDAGERQNGTINDSRSGFNQGFLATGAQRSKEIAEKLLA